jgi:Lrp/AsnC family transcriptional regulator
MGTAVKGVPKFVVICFKLGYYPMMTHKIDGTDRRILRLMQDDATLSVDQLSEQVSLSRNACWRRVKVLEEAGVIARKVALLNPYDLGLSLHAIVMIRASAHTADWTAQFQDAVKYMPEIMGAYRTTGDLDYVLRVRVADITAYDRFYKDLTGRVDIADVSASFVMEEIKDTTALPI